MMRLFDGQKIILVGFGYVGYEGCGDDLNWQLVEKWDVTSVM